MFAARHNSGETQFYVVFLTINRDIRISALEFNLFHLKTAADQTNSIGIFIPDLLNDGVHIKEKISSLPLLCALFKETVAFLKRLAEALDATHELMRLKA